MPQTTNHKFKITVPITRCYLRKSADGVEKYVVEGMASNTDLDLTGERMADTAIASMAKSLGSHPVLFKNEHGDEWDAEFGEVTALYATDAHQLMMEAELDPDHCRTKTLVKALEKGKELGLSIGGMVVESGYEWLSDLGRKVKTYKDILLEEISVTGSPAVPGTWLTNITKSVKDWKDEAADESITKAADWKVGAARDLPITEDDSWDGQEAKDSVFAWAGWPDSPDPSKAKQAFLAYDASIDTEKGAYKLPFARFDGELKTSTAGINAAASRLPQTDLPQEIADAARAVLDAYQAKQKSVDATGEEPSMKKSQDAPEEEVLAPDQPTIAPTQPDEVTTEQDVTDEGTDAPETGAQAPEESPVDGETAGQEDEEAKTDGSDATPSAPDQADPDTSEVAKAAVLGTYAEADLTESAVSTLAWNVQYAIWSAMADERQTPDERLAFIDAALTEFHQLVMAVATALASSGTTDGVARALETLQVNSPEAIEKTLTAKDATNEELTKSLALKDEEIQTLTKSIEESKTQSQNLTDELEKYKARKAFVFGKFGEAIAFEDADDQHQDTTQSLMERWLAHEGAIIERNATQAA